LEDPLRQSAATNPGTDSGRRGAGGGRRHIADDGAQPAGGYLHHGPHGGCGAGHAGAGHCAAGRPAFVGALSAGQWFRRRRHSAVSRCTAAHPPALGADSAAGWIDHRRRGACRQWPDRPSFRSVPVAACLEQRRFFRGVTRPLRAAVGGGGADAGCHAAGRPLYRDRHGAGFCGEYRRQLWVADGHRRGAGGHDRRQRGGHRRGDPLHRTGGTQCGAGADRRQPAAGGAHDCAAGGGHSAGGRSARAAADPSLSGALIQPAVDCRLPGISPGPAAREEAMVLTLWRQPAVRVLLLAIAAVLCVLGFMTINVQTDWAFILQHRGSRLLALLLAASAIGLSTVLFQTITHSRLLTPALMGFDVLFVLVNTLVLLIFGGAELAGWPSSLRVGLQMLLMVGLALLLFRLLFSGSVRSLHLMILLGMLAGMLFRE